MANSSLKKIINARSTSFKMTGNKTVSTTFSSSDLGSDYFSLYVSGGSYQVYSVFIFYNDLDEIGEHGGLYKKTPDEVGWPHSSPYVPGAAIQMQICAPTAKKYSINVKLNCVFGFNDNSSSPANSIYKFRIDVDGKSIHDDKWKNGDNWPYNQNMVANITVPNSLKWVDFGTYNVTLSKGLHTILMRFGACHRYNKHASIYINNMRVSLT